MIKNIFNLTKILLKNSVTIPYIINKKTKEINKKFKGRNYKWIRWMD